MSSGLQNEQTTKEILKSEQQLLKRRVAEDETVLVELLGAEAWAKIRACVTR